MYILECSNGSYYTGSTKNLERRLQQHQNGDGANHTKKHLPVKLVYFETFSRIDEAFYREKQIQGWSRKKKEALINGFPEKLHDLAKCLNETSHVAFGSVQSTCEKDSKTVAFDSAQSTKDRNAKTVVERSQNDLLENDNAVAFDSGQSTCEKDSKTVAFDSAHSTCEKDSKTVAFDSAQSTKDRNAKTVVERSRNNLETQN
ncbi:Predicted endonuclease, GIY-YIG superfamily [Psychroflexus salarius]|uniref:Predicted endonuclease, GIY-YIG superfamily n=2 Tax=Psychroflexus salarius TaxID=1155689 RepID=A0A1M4Y270_9FLAO|nr:Predicted endonuclease, GIY-YIG superfamily [Psychroflexus salarius]